MISCSARELVTHAHVDSGGARNYAGGGGGQSTYKTKCSLFS